MKRVTALVLAWNGLALTRATLDSLRRCRMPAGWALHLMVVDNASTDGTPEALRAGYPDVELIALPENRRFAGGNNAGLARALERGDDAVMLLNNDVLADPGLVERLLLALEQTPGAGAAAPLIYHAAPSNVVWYAGGRCIPWLAHASHTGIRERDHGQWRSIEETGYLTGCCLLATREVWQRVGLLDERYFIYAEDADWSLRARAAGYRLLFVPTARLWHEVSASSGGAVNPWKIHHRLRANWTLWSSHARGLARLTWLPAFLLQQAVLMGALFARGHARAAAAVPRALWHACTGRPVAGGGA